MPKFYSRWISDWEYKLATRDTNRVVRRFDWGLDWLGMPPANGNSGQALGEYRPRRAGGFRRFLRLQDAAGLSAGGGQLTFTSPVQTPYPENNRVRAAFFPARRDTGRAVLVLPQWNADEQSHVGLCKLLNRFGITALRMNLAYHGRACRRSCSAPITTFRATSAAPSTLAGNPSSTCAPAWTGWSSRATGAWGSWAPAWDPAWPSSRPLTTGASPPASSITCPCISPTWSGRGFPPSTFARASVGR